MAKVTPVRKQYLDVKKQFPNAIVLFRLGDFYETFDDDAKLVAAELDLVLTSRNVSKGSRIPMAGVPHHAAENYIARLIDKGYHVAICEQVSDKPVNGLMPREVVRVVTPGTVTEPSLLEEKRNNYLMAVAPHFSKQGVLQAIGIAYADISTGEFSSTEVKAGDIEGLMQQEIARLSPRECVLPLTVYEDGLIAINTPASSLSISPYADWHFDAATAQQTLEQHFQVASLEAFGLEEMPYATAAAGAALAYLTETQRGSINQITRLTTYTTTEYMVLDAATRRNLELTATMREHRGKGTLIDVLDQTTTAMGGRLLRQWLSRPLLDLTRLNKRHDAVEALYVDGMLRTQLREALNDIADIERLTNRILTGTAGPRELLSLRSSLEIIPEVRGLLIGQDQILRSIANYLNPVEDAAQFIATAVSEDTPATLNNIGVIKQHFSPELDSLLSASSSARDYINSLESVERKATGIKNLKVGYNKVFGYYIEVTKSNIDHVPEHYVRKQTLVNAERYITPEMKEVEVKLNNADEEILQLERELFKQVLSECSQYADDLLDLARTIASLDVCATFAEVAAREGYVRPHLSEADTLYIKAGRHPVVEQLLNTARFVPNDTSFTEDERIHLITGPNMSGKSTYLRQVALVTLLAQIGSFVPADEAHIGLVDRIFTRLGAQDEIYAGQSTFMVEMIETATILQQSTQRSLIVLDEIGRGTSTYDGLAIARAVVEYLHSHPRMGGKTLFATHYHELTELESILPNVVNYHVQVAEQGDSVVFLHTINKGKAGKSYGIHVAGLAGVPKAVVQRASEILRDLEEQAGHWRLDDTDLEDTSDEGQMSFFHAGPHPALESLRKLKIDEMSPIDAITALYELQRQVEGD